MDALIYQKSLMSNSISEMVCVETCGKFTCFFDFVYVVGSFPEMVANFEDFDKKGLMNIGKKWDFFYYRGTCHVNLPTMKYFLVISNFVRHLNRSQKHFFG